jgi:choline dehydrogenase-like flavoprotein
VSPTLVRGERPGLTLWEQLLRAGVALLGLTCLYFAVKYIADGLSRNTEFPFVANSLAKDGVLVALCWLTFWDVRRFSVITVPLLVLAHLLLIAGMATTGWWDSNTSIQATWTSPPSGAGALRTTWMISDGVVVAGLLFLRWKALRSRFDMRYLSPAAFRGLMALSEVLVLREDREVTPAEVAVGVDHYLASFRASQKWKVRVALTVFAYWPLWTLHPPLWVMSPEIRERWVRKRFEKAADRRLANWLKTIITTAQQFVFVGYYGDERAAAKAGYIPFSQRHGFKEAIARVDHDRPGVTCMGPADVAGGELNADVVIVGTGAAGATLAYELAQRGREVLLLERGPHIDPRDFTETETTQLSNLYADGALTMSKDFNFHVAQGMCVGGSTVVNNAVCFDLPDHVLDRWLDPSGLNAGLDPARLRAAFQHVRQFLSVSEAGPDAVLNPGARRVFEGLQKTMPSGFRLVECNIEGCLGCGYCNIGCAFGKKLSALDWTLPLAQQLHPDAVRILPDCRVEKVLMRDNRATGVQARLGDGRRLSVSADVVVVSAGAIASSAILQCSGLGEGRAGSGLAFNMASPVTLDFAEELHSERGMQITHYLEPENGGGGLALESWFNPIVSQSLFMPGWFEQHWHNMRRYPNMTCLGVVIGTEGNAKVTTPWPFRTTTLDYKPSDEDFVKIKDGLKLAAQVGLRAGAKRVLPSTFRMMEIHSEDELPKIMNEIGDDRDLSVNSAHPQGGNPMSKEALKGVVDPSFRVYGTLNVHVVDASVFPSSITVNPQLTVMALAAYAADEIAGPPRSGNGRGDYQLLGSISQGPDPGPGS